jgi:AAA domain
VRPLAQDLAGSRNGHDPAAAATIKARAARFGIKDPEARAAFEQALGVPVTLGTPLAFDFDRAAAPPEWLVERQYAVGTSNLSSAAKASGKTFGTLDLCVCIASGGGVFLGRRVRGGRVLYIHEEDPAWRVEARWKAVARVRGFTNTHRANLRYYHKQGTRLDGPGVMPVLEEEIESYRPALVVVDTTTSATNTDLMSQREAANVMGELRRIADRQETVIKVLHHKRKGQAGFVDDADTAAMGAAAWTNQVDGHETWEWLEGGEEDYAPAEGDPFPVEGGRWRTWTAFRWTPDHNMRDGGRKAGERVVFESVKDAQGTPVWLTTRSEGEMTPGGSDDEAEKTAAAIAWAVWERGRMRRKQIATVVGERNPSNPSGTFHRGIGIAERRDWIAEAEPLNQGWYDSGGERPPGEPPESF